MIKQFCSYISLALKFLSAMPSIPIAILIVFLYNQKKIKIGYLLSQRLGHLAANTELFLCETELHINGCQDCLCLLYLEEPPVANNYLIKMWGRHESINIIPRFLGVSLTRALKLIPGGNRHFIPTTLQSDRDIRGLYPKTKPHLSLTRSEIQEGYRFLASLGLTSDSKFVCLTVRDSAYLKHYLKNDDYSYHDYRDSDINDYLEACNLLSKNGYYVFRMGVRVNSSLNSSNPMIIDYANSGFRTEFLDIFLAYQCSFCITQGTGFDALPIIFRKPILQVNAVPVGYANTFVDNCLFIPKHYSSKLTNKRVSLRDQVELGLFNHLGEHDGFVIENNSSDEILEACNEMISRLEGKYVYDDDHLQEQFWMQYPLHIKSKYSRCSTNPINSYIGARIGTSFLRKNPYYLSA